MAHYRKIDTRIWNDGKLNALSPDGKLVFLFLLTHPNLTVLGAMRMSALGVAGELQLPFDRAESPNVVKSWDNVIQYLPEGKLKTVLMGHARKIVLQLGQGFQDALPELFYPLGFM